MTSKLLVAWPIISIRLRTQLSGCACEVLKSFVYSGSFPLTHAASQVKSSVKKRLPKQGREEGENKLVEVQKVIGFDSVKVLRTLSRSLAVQWSLCFSFTPTNDIFSILLNHIYDSQLTSFRWAKAEREKAQRGRIWFSCSSSIIRCPCEILR